jgi:predicted transcriptional regulator
MLRFLKNRSSGDAQRAAKLGPLGHLENAVMEVLWSRGESRVQEVIETLQRPLAYTTVMTTLDRLFKKGLLDRRKQDRAFVYDARLSRPEWERRRAEDLVAGFLAGPEPSRGLLLSCFLEAVGEQDAPLLDELAQKIRVKRKGLSRTGGS